MALSVIVHLRHSYRPLDVLLAPDDRGRLRPQPVSTAARRRLPGRGRLPLRREPLLRERGPSRADELLTLAAVRSGAAPDRDRGRPIGDVDYSGSAELAEVRKELAERGVTLELCDLQDRVRTQLRRDGLLDAIGPEHIFETVDDALAGHGG